MSSVLTPGSRLGETASGLEFNEACTRPKALPRLPGDNINTADCVAGRALSCEEECTWTRCGSTPCGVELGRRVVLGMAWNWVEGLDEED